MTGGRILLIEDDPDITRVVRAYLEQEGFGVVTAADGAHGLDLILSQGADLIVLDWMLPGLDGIEILKRMRPAVQTPVILLTAREEAEDRLRGFEHGADDFVPKPFHPPELVARVHAVLRRSRPAGTNQRLKVGDLIIDPQRRQVSIAGMEIHLTSLEFDLLHLLAMNPGRVYRRNELLDRVWGRDFTGVDRVVDVHVSNLRQKLEENVDATFLQTVRGVGYSFREGIS